MAVYLSGFYAFLEYHYRYLKGPHSHNTSIHFLDVGFLVDICILQDFALLLHFQINQIWKKNFRVLYPRENPSNFFYLGPIRLGGPRPPHSELYSPLIQINKNETYFWSLRGAKILCFFRLCQFKLLKRKNNKNWKNEFSFIEPVNKWFIQGVVHLQHNVFWVHWWKTIHIVPPINKKIKNQQRTQQDMEENQERQVENA